MTRLWPVHGKHMHFNPLSHAAHSEVHSKQAGAACRSVAGWLHAGMASCTQWCAQVTLCAPCALGCGRPWLWPATMEALREILASIYVESHGEPPARDLDYVEVFAGEAAVSRGLATLGFVGRSVDQRYNPELDDVLTPHGFVSLACHVARLRPGGLFWAAPPCSSWIFLSSSSTGRHLDVEGDPNNPGVVAQNALVQRLLILCAFARSRGVAFIWEQPGSSCMFAYPDVVDFQEACPDVRMVKTMMGAHGLLTMKDAILWGTPSYLGSLRVRMKRMDKVYLRLRPDKTVTTRRWVTEAGEVKCQGAPGLKGTQAYTLGFGAAHALAFQAWTETVVPEPLPPPPPPRSCSPCSTLRASVTLRIERTAGTATWKGRRRCPLCTGPALAHPGERRLAPRAWLRPCPATN